VLDIACGSGRITERLLANGLSATGLDVSQAMLQGADRRLLSHEGLVGLVRGDSVALPFPDRCFDGVTSFRLMGHLPPCVRQTALREIARVARRWVIVTHNHLWSIESLGNLPGRWLRPLLRRTSQHVPRRPLSFAGMREEFSRAGLAVEWIHPCRLGWDEECVVLARPVRSDPNRNDIVSRAANSPAEGRLAGSHGARVVQVDERRYVVKLQHESVGEFLAYCARLLQLNWFAADFVKPIPRRARIRAALTAMEEWRIRGFPCPEPVSGLEDDYICYPFLELPGLRARVRESNDPLPLVEHVAGEVFRRHRSAGARPIGRECLLFHLDSRWDNILLDGDQPVWIDFDRGFRGGTAPDLLKSRELVTFCRSVLRNAPEGEADNWLAAVVRAYPDKRIWSVAVGWLQQASLASQGPVARYKHWRNPSFHGRHMLASRLRAVIEADGCAG